MSKQREAFERWAKDDGLTMEVLTYGEYSAFSTQVAWEAWQASRAAALEEAAAECVRTYTKNAVSFELGYACANAIRALKEQS